MKRKVGNPDIKEKKLQQMNEKILNKELKEITENKEELKREMKYKKNQKKPK